MTHPSRVVVLHKIMAIHSNEKYVQGCSNRNRSRNHLASSSLLFLLYVVNTVVAKMFYIKFVKNVHFSLTHSYIC